MTRSERCLRREIRKSSDFQSLVQNFKILSYLAPSGESAFEYSYTMSRKDEVVEKRLRATLIGRDRETFELLWLLVKDSKERSSQSSYDPLEEFSRRFPGLEEELKRNVRLEDTSPDFSNLTWLRQRY